MCGSAAETPIPREPESENERTITIIQTRGETRQNTARVWLREARGEAAGHSGQRSPHPALHAASQTPTLPGPQRSLCRGNWAHGCRAAPQLCWSSGCRGGGSCLGPHSPEGRGFAGWEARGLAAGKGSALEGIIGRFLNSLSHYILGFNFFSFPDYISAACIYSSWEAFHCPMSFPCQCSQTPCEPLCAHRGPPETRLFAGHCLGVCSHLRV